MSKEEVERIQPEPTWDGPRVFLDFNIADRPIGRVIIELRPDVCPRTCENFRQLCTGEHKPKGYPVGYKDTIMHRIIPGILIQGGDVERNDGTGVMSIYGYTFNDERSAFSFGETGIVGMANMGPNTNGSQFFITTANVEELDGKYVAFGKVIDGMLTVRKIANVPLVPDSETPTLKIYVAQCGEL